MGTDMNGAASRALAETGAAPAEVMPIPWLDAETAAAVADIIRSLAEHHREVQAVILFGSVARQEERSSDDPEPSDVDLLLILDPTARNSAAARLTHERELALARTIGEADYRHRHALRAVDAFFMHHDLAGWDATFIANVARDGVLLWARAPLPAALAAVAARLIPPAPPDCAP